LHATTRTFAALWGLALLHHQLGYGVALAGPTDVALTIAAAALLVVPRVEVLALAAIAHLLAVVDHLPVVYNHWWFAAWISAAVLLAMLPAWQARRGGGGESVMACFAEAFAPPARRSLILLYLLAGFHKLNTDFLTPGISCGTILTTQLGNTLGVSDLGARLGMVPIGVTLAAELGIPILLLVRRTRAAGILGALGFHLAMALAGFPRFSSTGLALLWLFLPVGTRLPVVGRLWATARSRLAVVAALLAAQVIAQDAADAILLTVLVLITGALGAAAWRARRSSEWIVPSGRVGLADLVPACVLLIGCLPYLGLATDRTWGMYSNLRVEGAATNHLLVPVALQRFDLPRDLVAVQASSAARLQSLALNGQVVPWVEFRARVTEASAREGGEVAVTYMRGGRLHEVPRVSADSLLSRPVSRWHRKFWRFRPVEAAGPRACTV
jgi:hypothetical protein